MVLMGVDYDTIIGPLRHPCDLHILLFFSRFPRVLLTNERLAQYVGYDVQQVAKSVETLIAAAILSRAQNSNHEARFYVFTPTQLQAWVQQVVSTASTQEGRTRLIQALKNLQLRQKPDGPGGAAVQAVPLQTAPSPTTSPERSRRQSDG